MIAVPFIYFSIIAIWQFKRNKNRIDIGCYIASIYAISGFFSILYEQYNIGNNYYGISLFSCLVYCLLLTLNLFPFLKYTHLDVEITPSVSLIKPVRILAWVSICWFVIMLLLSYKQIMDMLTGDMLAARNAVYNGIQEGGWMSNLPTIIRFPISLINMCFGTPWVLIMMGFYCFYILKLPLRYFLFYFIASLSGPISGILGADRSANAYWLLSLIGVYIMFYYIIPQKHKKYINTFLAIIIAMISIYLSMMTVARFGDRNMGVGISGVEGSLISYLGQSYPNFCYFLEYFEPAFTNLNLLFPNTAKFVFGSELVGGVNLQQEMDLRTGIRTGVFYIYLGQIRIFCGIIVLILFVLSYNIFTTKQLKYIRKCCLSLKKIFVYIGLSSIMFLGIFAYYYAGAARVFSILFFLLFINYISEKKRGT